MLGLIGALGAAAVGGGAATLTAVRARAHGRPGPGQLSSAQHLVAARAAALARATATADTLSAALSGLRTQAEALAERYDHEVSLEQQAAAAYQAAQARLAAARKSERRAAAQLARLAAAEYESDGGPSMAAAVFAGITDPRGYLGAIGLQAAMDDQRTDLLAATRADAIVTRLFSVQAAGLLAQRRTAAQAAGFLRAALVAAVSQAGLVRLAVTSRSRLAAQTASARASEAALASAGVAAPGRRDDPCDPAGRGRGQRACGRPERVRPGRVRARLGAGRRGERRPGGRGRRLGAHPARPALPVGRGRAGLLRLLRARHAGVGQGGRPAAALDRVPVGIRAARAAGPAFAGATWSSTPTTSPTRPPSITSGSTSAAA